MNENLTITTFATEALSLEARCFHRFQIAAERFYSKVLIDMYEYARNVNEKAIWLNARKEKTPSRPYICLCDRNGVFR